MGGNEVNIFIVSWVNLLGKLNLTFSIKISHDIINTIYIGLEIIILRPGILRIIALAKIRRKNILIPLKQDITLEWNSEYLFDDFNQPVMRWLIVLNAKKQLWFLNNRKGHTLQMVNGIYALSLDIALCTLDIF